MYTLVASSALYLSGFWRTAITKCLPVAFCAITAYHRRYASPPSPPHACQLHHCV